MVLRHKLTIRAATAGWLVLCTSWVVGERTPQSVVVLGVALLFFTASVRALIVVRDDSVHRRGLLGWVDRPLGLSELTAVSLRREAGVSRTVPLILRLSGPAGAEVTIECWLWTGWRGLAHRAGHFARQLDARRDPVTGRRMACTRPACPWESHVADVVGGRRAGPAPNDDVSRMSVLEIFGVIAVMFVLGFLFGVSVSWLRADPDSWPLMPFAAACGGLFAVGGVCAVLW